MRLIYIPSRATTTEVPTTLPPTTLPGTTVPPTTIVPDCEMSGSAVFV